MKNTIRSIMAMFFVFSVSIGAMDSLSGSEDIPSPELFKSLVSGPASGLKDFIKAVGKVDISDKEGKTLLWHACDQSEKLSSKPIKELVFKGASFDKAVYSSGRYVSILPWLFKWKRFSMIEKLFSLNWVNPNQAMPNGAPLFHFFIKKEWPVECLRLCIEGGAKVNAVCKDGSSALSRAVSLQLYDHAELLLNKGANPNALSISDGMLTTEECSLLEETVIYNDSRMFDLLYGHRAKVTKKCLEEAYFNSSGSLKLTEDSNGSLKLTKESEEWVKKIERGFCKSVS